MNQQPDLDKANYRGETPLYLATINRSLDIADMLIKAGANPNIADKNGNQRILPCLIKMMKNGQKTYLSINSWQT